MLKSALTGQRFELPVNFDLEKAIKTAKRHNISSMLYYGAYNCGISKETPFMRELLTTACENIAISELQMYELGRICDLFENNGIDYLPLKGSILKGLYQKEEMR